MATKKSSFLIPLIVILFLVVPSLTALYVDYIWFQSLGFKDVFTTVIFTQIWVVIITSILFFIIQLVNVLFASREQKAKRKQMIKDIPLKTKLLITAAISVVVGLSYRHTWQKVLLYLEQVPFEVDDPVFTKDLAFYVFSLPFFAIILKFLMVCVIAAFIITAIIYVLNGQLSFISATPKIDPKMIQPKQMNFGLRSTRKVKLHLSFIGSLFFILLAVHYYLKRYYVLYSTQGIITGAGYTDVMVTLPILMFLVIVSIVIAVELFIWPNILKRKNIIPITIGAFLIIAFVALSIIPGVVQYFKVLPNELKLESPYIDNNILYTRFAYGLDNIEEVDYTTSSVLPANALEDNQITFDNIRLWDHRPLKQTYNQLQEIRLYYDFLDVDIDRYTIDGKYSQVMLSAREMNQRQLPAAAQTWVNQKLVFTHGLGVTLSPVNQFTTEGLPNLYVKDLPPQTDIESLEITRPQIYFGEGPLDYVITDTATEEFDYAKGDANVFTNYKGKDGIKVESLFRKLLFAIRFGDVKILLTDDISADSRMVFYRNIQERIKILAPFLKLDPDPYIVISDGKLVWIQDAYTTADSLPYSSFTKVGNYEQINYIRNSVKIVIDAYDGNPTFYVLDNEDPIIQTFSHMFPSLFKPYSAMPMDLKKHVRYPEELFKIQSKMYSTYHMKNSNVFYNKEDVWGIPGEIYGEGQEIVMEPYYMIMHLPDQEKEEFILMTPFTPHKKANMIGWLAARSDGDAYGKLLVYKFPKEKLVYGPMQIEARIDQDSSISEQITLWDQRGSTVIRGNTLVIPIDHSIIYVEPLYIIAEKTQLPELKRVIVSDGTRVFMERDLETALRKLFTTEKKRPAQTNQTEYTIEYEDDLIEQALSYYSQVDDSMKSGDWTGIGENLNNLKSVLEELKKEVDTGETT
ncbi:UPF0182 family protein [Nanoarchaeota archaeon]